MQFGGIIVDFDEFFSELAYDRLKLLLFLPGSDQLPLHGLELLLLLLDLVLRDLQVDLDLRLVVDRLLVHQVHLLEGSFKSLCFLLVLLLISGQAQLELPIRVLDVTQFHLQLDDFVDSILQVFYHLIDLVIMQLLHFLNAFLRHPLCDFLDIWGLLS